MSPETAFLHAVEAGDISEINHLAESNPDVDLNHMTPSGHSLLWWAVLAVNTPSIEVVQALLDLRADGSARLDPSQQWMGRRLTWVCSEALARLIDRCERHYRARPAATARPEQTLAEQFGTRFNTHQADEEVRRSFGRWLMRYHPEVTEQAISYPLHATERPHQTDLSVIKSIPPKQVQACKQTMQALLPNTPIGTWCAQPPSKAPAAYQNQSALNKGSKTVTIQHIL